MVIGRTGDSRLCRVRLALRLRADCTVWQQCQPQTTIAQWKLRQGLQDVAPILGRGSARIRRTARPGCSGKRAGKLGHRREKGSACRFKKKSCTAYSGVVLVGSCLQSQSPLTVIGSRPSKSQACWVFLCAYCAVSLKKLAQ